MTPTVAELLRRVTVRIGRFVIDVGLFFDSATDQTEATNDGIYKGASAVGLTPADPFVIADAEVRSLTNPKIQRIVDIAELHCIGIILLNWHRAAIRAGMPAWVKRDDYVAGWMPEEKQALLRRQAQLSEEIKLPLVNSRSGIVAVVNREDPPTFCGF